MNTQSRDLQVKRGLMARHLIQKPLLHPLDAFIPRPDVRERHAISIRAPAPVVFTAVEAFDFQSVFLIRAIIRLRQLLLHSTNVARQPQPFLKEALAMGWGVLARDPSRLFVAGAECQPWLGDVKFTPIPPAEFAKYQEPNRVKIAWTLEVEPLSSTSARLATETRVVATDPEARKRFLRYWRWARF
ncbi:MAG TPA: hypothetical protein VLB12_08730, partial [Gemmatimonadales bacterium]|nr:hypothetical protein [Gemmatimonadales bacterium]